MNTEKILNTSISAEQRQLAESLEQMTRATRYQRRILLTMFRLPGNYAYTIGAIAMSANGHWSIDGAQIRRKAFEELGWPKKK